MSWINHKVELKNEEINQYEGTYKNVKDIVADVAIRTGWHPAGYGIVREEIVEQDNKYYALWDSSDNCD